MLRFSLVLTLLIASGAAHAQDVLRGHGGPVRALAVNGAARELISGSFDATVIVWDVRKGVAKRVLRFHDAGVNTVLVDGWCIAAAGEDRKIALWCGDAPAPQKVFAGHDGPITALTAVPGGIVSAGFDGAVKLWTHGYGLSSRTRIIDWQSDKTLHTFGAAATALTWQSNGDGVIAGSADGELRVLSRSGKPGGSSAKLIAPVTALITADNGEILAAGADGRLRLLSPQLDVVAEIEVEPIPLASLAISPDGRLVATAGLSGGIAIIERASRKVIHRLTGPGLPVWSLAFDSDNRTLFSGGADRVIRRWDAVAGRALTSNLPERDIVAEAAASGERGAVVFRACQACHTLSPDGGNRAGPTLHGVFGRRIGTAPDYAYSVALPAMQIVWGKDTIARLFEVGPTAYTPGTKMPEQTITDPADRKALVDWLERVTLTR